MVRVDERRSNTRLLRVRVRFFSFGSGLVLLSLFMRSKIIRNLLIYGLGGNRTIEAAFC